MAGLVGPMHRRSYISLSCRCRSGACTCSHMDLSLGKFHVFSVERAAGATAAVGSTYGRAPLVSVLSCFPLGIDALVSC